MTKFGSKTIVIQLHARQGPLEGSLIWDLKEVWERMGIKITIIRGVDQPVHPDLLISHIDLTRVPREYVDYQAGFDKVINRNVIDISKRAISLNLLNQGDKYQGPVLIKPDLNALGMNEILWRFPIQHGKLTRLVKSWQARKYRVLEDISQVPPSVWKSTDLVVEKFLPEKEGDLYFLRLYIFMGDKYVRVGSPSAVIKYRSNLVSREVGLEVPEEILNLRKSLNFDYGKFDYVIHQGRPILLDANSTPGWTRQNKGHAETLAPGIIKFLD